MEETTILNFFLTSFPDRNKKTFTNSFLTIAIPKYSICIETVHCCKAVILEMGGWALWMVKLGKHIAAPFWFRRN
jgi:hypothetical protein